MFKQLLQKLPYFLVGSIALFGANIVFAAILNGYQGGTGIGTATSSDVGKILTVASSTPWLTYTFSTPFSGGSGTSTQVAYYNGANSLTSSAGFTTDGSSSTLSGQLNVGTFIKLPSSTQPVVSNQDLVLHNMPVQGIPRLENDSLFTLNGCDVVNRDNCVIVKNNQGSNITLGQAVYVNGGVGANPQVRLAQANATSTSATLGLVASTTVANNGFTYVMTKGILSNVDTSAFAQGDVLYLSPTVAGGLTNVRPSYPNLIDRIGTVMVSNATNGQILIEVAPAVLGQETGTISSSFNIGGNTALTTATGLSSATPFVSSTVAGSNITVSGATGAVTIAVTSTPSFTTVNGVTPANWLTKATDYKSIQWSASYTSSTQVFDDPIFTFTATSTIDKVFVSSRDTNNRVTWNLGYSTDPTTASSSAFKLFTASQVTTSTPGSAFTFTPNASSTPGSGQTLRLFSDTASSTITTWTIWYHET